MEKHSSNREFRKIKSLEFLYEINCDGTILRNVKSKKHIKIKLDMYHSLKGYYMAWICIKNEVKRIPIHRVVAECWLGERPDGYEIDHIDRNSHNNHYTNLRYVTHREQMKNRVITSEKLIVAQYNNLKRTWENNSKKVFLYKGTFSREFQSMSECAKFLANEYNKSFEQMRWKLKSRRKHIYDYDVKYFSECRD